MKLPVCFFNSLFLVVFSISTYAAQIDENYLKGQKAYFAKEYSLALDLLLKSASLDNPKAQFSLGTMYLNGEGVEKDYKKAVKWFLKSAEQGDADSQTNLGSMYSLGYGVIKSEKKAFKWFELGAKQGNPMAQYNLAIMYYNQDDIVDAYTWFIVSAASGNKEAANGKVLIESELTEINIEKAEVGANEILDILFESE